MPPITPCTTYMHTIKHIHCHSKKRDVKRRHSLSVVQAPGREAGAHARRREDDDDEAPLPVLPHRSLLLTPSFSHSPKPLPTQLPSNTRPQKCGLSS
jgi:hypothetical protein